MEGKRQISQPFGRVSPDVLKWKQSLRDDRKGAYLADVPSSLRRSGSTGNLRKSTGNLAANFSSASMSGKLTRTSIDLDRIEAEYIKNLQQQVYFLELEANYLREQARKATEMHPQMSVEAERMLTKLRQMQAEVDTLQVEVKRRESNLDMVSTEKERLQGRIQAEDESHRREKRLLLEEVVQLKKQKDLLDRESERKDNQIMQAQDELNKSTSALKSAENKLQMLRGQLDQKMDQHKLTEVALNEKRAEHLKTETQLREIEDKYYSSTANLQDKLTQDLREEIRMLRQKLKEAEMHSDQDRYLRSKLADDSSHLVKENALLSQQVLELQKLLERERNLRESNDNRRSQSITELVLMKDRDKQSQFEVEQLKDMLKSEKGRVKHYMEQLSKQEMLSTSTSLNANTSRSKLAELESIHQSVDSENGALRRDKMLLVDHVADLQKKLEEGEREILTLRSQLHSMNAEVKELSHLKIIEATLHSQKWDEFSRLAESMKSLSKSMAHTPSPSPRASKLLDYS